MADEVKKSILDLEEKTSPQVTDYVLIMDSAGKKIKLQKIFDAIRNSILSGMNKLLFSGNLNAGDSIDIPEINNYKIYAVSFQGQGTAAMCIRHGNFIRGGGTFPSETLHTTLTADMTIGGTNNTTVTLTRASSEQHTAIGNHSALTTLTVTGIVGII